MPTYDYRCNECGHTCEIFQAITDKPKRQCPVCKRRKMVRLIGSGAGIIFKGSGFYETDYRSKTYQDDAQKEKNASSCAKAADSSTSSEKTSKSKKKSESTKKSDKLKVAG
jgi:putative FmdB family regulatory protein